MDAIEPTPHDFIRRIDTLDIGSDVRAPGFIIRSLTGSASVACSLCHRSLVGATSRDLNITPLIHPMLGGTESSENWILLCASCLAVRASADLLAVASLVGASAPLSPALVEQRHRVLLESRNHLTRHSPKSNVDLVSAELRKRHQHPRFRVYGWHGEMVSYLGMTVRYGDWMSKAQAIAMTRHKSQSVEIEHQRMEEVRVFQMETAEFRRVVWELIAMNAWVVPVLEGSSASSEVDDYWFVSMTSPHQLRARKHLSSGVVLPHLPKRYSMKSDAICHRNRYREEAMAKLEVEMKRIDLQLTDLSMAAALNELVADAPSFRTLEHRRNDLSVKHSQLGLARRRV